MSCCHGDIMLWSYMYYITHLPGQNARSVDKSSLNVGPHAKPLAKLQLPFVHSHVWPSASVLVVK